MAWRWDWREHVGQWRFLLRWVGLAGGLGVVVGSAVALFLWGLDVVTAVRWGTVRGNGLPWLLYLLPVAGVVVVEVYRVVGKGSERGNSLIMDEIHEPGGGVPARMAPLVLVGTWVTHMFGGSAGREGTAVQMGGSIAGVMGRVLKLSKGDVRLLLMAGIAGGFGAVFGTPIAGAVFAVEVLAIGRMSVEGPLPCLIAGLVGDWVCGRWGIRHTGYHVEAVPLEGVMVVKVVVAGILFGLASVLFASLTHGLSRVFGRIKWAWLRPVVGGVVVIGLALFVGRSYLGLGVISPFKGDVTILSCFSPGGAGVLSWWWKILFTAVTLSCGFKGGEVTPLFFIGAALGNVLAGVMGGPVDLFAGLGFVAVFAGATNTPLACTIMGMELFGSGNAGYMAVACFVAYLFSGLEGIYPGQRVGGKI